MVSAGIYVLLGIVLGGLITVLTEIALERWRTTHAKNAALRLLSDDLMESWAAFDTAQRRRQLWPQGIQVSPPTWEENRDLIARAVQPVADWRVMRDAVANVRAAESAFEVLRGQSIDQKLFDTVVGDTLTGIEAALLAINDQLDEEAATVPPKPGGP